MGFKPKTLTERILADYYDGFSSLRCQSAEARAEAIGPTAGSPSWIPTSTGRSRGPENWLARRCDIAIALAELDEAHQWLLMMRIGMEYSWEALAAAWSRAVRTVRDYYYKALGLVQCELVERGVLRGRNE